jgi:putative membrane protein
MRHFAHHGLIAAGTAVIAIACGSPDKPASDPHPQQPLTSAEVQKSTFGSGEAQKPLTSPGDGAAVRPRTITTLSDGEIFAIETVLNDGEVSLGEMMKKRGTSARVKDFAGLMIVQHRDAQTKAKAIAVRNRIAAADDETSNTLKKEITDTAVELQTKNGGELDRAYIESQVRMHKEALDIVDDQLLTSVKNGELKDHLSAVRHHVADHLARARDIASSFETGETMSRR